MTAHRPCLVGLSILLLHHFSIIATFWHRPIVASAFLVVGRYPVRSATFRLNSLYTRRFASKVDDHDKMMIPPSPETFQNLKGVFVGSGSDGMANPKIADLILREFLAPQTLQEIHVVYLGTATYDIISFAKRQTDCFLQYPNVKVHFCNVVDSTLSENERSMLESAHVIVVGGGNTLFAMDRWKTVGLLPLLERARQRGCVLAGGSAGAICWFDAGHSDSMDPDTYKHAMLAKFSDAKDSVGDESTALGSEKKEWKYNRVPGLGYLPGLVCPHFDRTQSNGVLREKDFDQMLLSRHSGELGIGIDHWAALVVDGDSYRVISLDKRTDSDEGAGVWIKQVVVHEGEGTNDTTILTQRCPDHGKLSELLRLPNEIRPDEEAVTQCRQENPDEGPKAPR
jgi:dipeptidase E